MINNFYYIAPRMHRKEGKTWASHFIYTEGGLMFSYKVMTLAWYLNMHPGRAYYPV